METLYSANNFQLIIDYAIDKLAGYVPKFEFDKVFQNEDWSEEDKKHIIKQLNELIIKIATNSEFEIGRFDSKQINYIKEAIAERQADILKVKIKEHNSNNNSIVNNYNWKLKWIIGSSVSSQTKYPIVQVDFSNLKLFNNEIINENISIEMTKEELSQLIEALESVKAIESV